MFNTGDDYENDSLYGEDGDDILIGNRGDNILDGGQGSDRFIGGEGSDAFIIEASNGALDIIEDFEDGIDSIGLAGGLFFDSLDISQSGNDTLISISDTGEGIAKLEGVSSDLIASEDFFSAILILKLLQADNSNNVLNGGMAGDTISTGSGDDIVNGSLGDDTIIVDGSGNKDINGR